jgi:hypothetical protein
MTSDATIAALADAALAWGDPDHPRRARAVRRTLGEGNRFTDEALAFALNQAMAEIDRASLERWLGGRTARRLLRVGVLEAGNVPLAGLQDYLAVQVVGHAFVGTTSSRSPHLLPAFAAEVVERGGPAAEFVPRDALFARAEAIVASGSDQTREAVAALCDEAGIPTHRRLLRGMRFGVAVLDGRESEDDHLALAEDALLHEGQGCRNVAIVWAPEDLAPDDVLEAFAVFRGTFPVHPSTAGSLRMQQAFLKAVDAPHAHADGMAFLVSRGAPEAQPPGHVRWVPYADIGQVAVWIREEAARIQVVAARPEVLAGLPEPWAHCELGSAQRPPLDWRPDGVDTIGFLAGLG